MNIDVLIMLLMAVVFCLFLEGMVWAEQYGDQSSEGKKEFDRICREEYLKLKAEAAEKKAKAKAESESASSSSQDVPE